MKGTTDRSSMENPALLEQLISLQKKELRHARFTSLASVVLIVAVVLALGVLAPKAMALMTQAQDSLREMDALAAEADELMRVLNDLSGDTEELIGNANHVIVSNTEAVTEAVGKMNDIDFERLNDAINDLADTVEPLANFANLFRGTARTG